MAGIVRYAHVVLDGECPKCATVHPDGPCPIIEFSATAGDKWVVLDMNATASNTSYDLCPACKGAGLVSRPPWVAGDVVLFTTSGAGPWSCRACDGKGLLRR